MENYDMDPEKALSAVAKALGLEEGADREQLVKALDALAALKEARDGEPEAEAPAEEEMPAEASLSQEASEEALQASVDDEGEAVEASADAPEAVELMEDQAAAGMAEQALQGLADMLGTSFEDALGLLQERMEEVASLLGGASPDGSAAEEEQAPMSRDVADDVAAVANGRIAALSRTVDETKAKLDEAAKRIAELEFEKVEARIDRAIECGKVLDVDRGKMVRLARKAPELLEDFIGDDASAQVTTKAPIKASKPRGAGFDMPDVSEHPDFESYEMQLRHVIKDKDERMKVIASRLASRSKEQPVSA